jgi:hypothetical protein
VAVSDIHNEFVQMREEAERRQALDENTLLEDLRWVMTDRRGRRLLWVLMERTRLFGATYTGNSATYYNLGRQDLGKWLYAQIRQASLRLWRQAEDEGIEREKERTKDVRRNSRNG